MKLIINFCFLSLSLIGFNAFAKENNYKINEIIKANNIVCKLSIQSKNELLKKYNNDDLFSVINDLGIISNLDNNNNLFIAVDKYRQVIFFENDLKIIGSWGPAYIKWDYENNKFSLSRSNLILIRDVNYEDKFNERLTYSCENFYPRF